MMDTHAMPPPEGSTPSPFFPRATNNLVEFSLVLPVQQAEALVRLSRGRNTSVAKILRQIITDALAAEE